MQQAKSKWQTGLDVLSCDSSSKIRVWHEKTGSFVEHESRHDVLKDCGRVGVVANQAVVNQQYTTCVEIIAELANVTCVLGPQHGYYQTEQDNMIETPDLRFNLTETKSVPLYSLYSKTREPTEEQLKDVDTLVVDMIDVGCRIYTFMLTMAGCLRAAAKINKRVIVLDRPNPIGLSWKSDKEWKRVEGNLLDVEKLYSFVGFYQIPLRHGLTMGELARFFVDADKLDVDLRIVCVSGDYTRANSFDASWFSSRWVLPSPNLPSWDSTFFFPSFVILEGTNVSEGRGSTTPFQLIGAPYLNSQAFINYIKKLQTSELGNQNHNAVTGIRIREHHFRPTFNKHHGEACRGLYFHAQNYDTVNLFALGQHFLHFTMTTHSNEFKYKNPPYEYNDKDLPILLIVGDERWKKIYDNWTGSNSNGPSEQSQEELDALLKWAHEGAVRFAEATQKFHLYA